MTDTALLAALHAGAHIRARKPSPFAATKYCLMTTTRNESDEPVLRDGPVVSEGAVMRFAKNGWVDTREAMTTFTTNATEYRVTLTDLGAMQAQAIKYTPQEVARAG